jgi:hypothetical protein
MAKAKEAASTDNIIAGVAKANEAKAKYMPEEELPVAEGAAAE